MNYVELHIGDYEKATAHLTACEDGIYGRLLRRYYDTEEPLPGDVKAVQRLVRARSKEERAAVETVLEEFFSLTTDGWRHGRCDTEIARYNEKRAKAKRSAEARWNVCERNANASKTHVPTQSEGNARQSPVTSNTEANASDAGASPAEPVDPIWGTGLAYLLRSRIPDKQARSLIGKLRQACGDVETGAILAQAEAEAISDPAPWLMASASKRRARAGPNGQQPMGKQVQGLMALEELKRGNRLDSGRDRNGAAEALPALAGPHAGR